MCPGINFSTKQIVVLQGTPQIQKQMGGIRFCPLRVSLGRCCGWCCMLYFVCRGGLTLRGRCGHSPRVYSTALTKSDGRVENLSEVSPGDLIFIFDAVPPTSQVSPRISTFKPFGCRRHAMSAYLPLELVLVRCKIGEVKPAAYLLNIRHTDALQDELSHAVSLVDLEVLAAMVEQHHSNRPAVVVVYNPRATVDHLFYGQPGPGGNTRVCVWRDGDGEVRFDESLASSWHRGLVGTEGINMTRKGVRAYWVQMQYACTGQESAAPCRNPSVVCNPGQTYHVLTVQGRSFPKVECGNKCNARVCFSRTAPRTPKKLLKFEI